MALTKVRNVIDVTADTMADLLTMKHKKGSVQLLGFHERGDGGGGVFYWDADESTANHNGGTIIAGNKDVSEATWGVEGAGTWFDAPAVATGCWKREFSGAVNVKWFGAKGNGTNEQVIIDYVNDSVTLVNLAGATFTYIGTFTPTVSFINGQITATNRNFYFNVLTSESPTAVLQGRARIDYFSSTAVAVWVPESVILAGFRIFGSYKKTNGRSISTATNGAINLNTTDLFNITTPKLENWYGVFAAANVGQSVATLRNAPFFRAFSVAGNVVNLSEGKETTGETPVATTYNMATDSLIGAEVLVIQHGGQFVGRVTTVTANTSGSITLADASGITAGDFFLVSPAGFTDYCYLGSWYLDNAEPRNIADTGTIVHATMNQIPNFPVAGALSAQKVNLRGVMSPLATTYIGNFVYSASTASSGIVSHEFWHDSSNHIIAQAYDNKLSAGSETYVHTQIQLAFSKEQAVWVTCVAGLAASVTGRSLQCYGWIEL